MKNENQATNKKQGRDVDSYGVDFDKSYIDACSANDCTGLIPSLPQSKAEIESYEELYHFLPKNS